VLTQHSVSRSDLDVPVILPIVKTIATDTDNSQPTQTNNTHAAQQQPEDQAQMKGSTPETGDTQSGKAPHIMILHFNDWHARVESCTQPWHELCDTDDVMILRTCSGGIGRMKKWLDDQR
jgi:hypothetical protein